MSRHLYNPFMPSVHFRDRAVFGGGGGGTPDPVIPKFKSSMAELAGKEFETEALMKAEEAIVVKDNKAIAEYVKALNAAVSAVTGEGLDAIAKGGLQIQRAQAVPKPGVTYNADKISTALNAKLTALNATIREAQGEGGADAATDVRKLVKTSLSDPRSLAKTADVATIDANLAGSTVATDTGAMTEPGAMIDPSTIASTATAEAPAPITTSTITPNASSTPAVEAAVANAGAAVGTVSAEGVMNAATKDPTTSAVTALSAASGAATAMNNPVQREIQAGELISGVADAAKAAAFTEQVQAASATPSAQATVKGQLDGLMQDFDGGATPSWAAGAMRNATAQMAARGLGASSMAGQAIVQAAMESALPIAMQDAQTVAGFEMANLSNRQQRAMLSAQQRAAFIGQEFDQGFQSRVANSAKISDIANMNFTAEQSVALENSRSANTMNLANLNNNQAMVMGQAAALANLDMANLANHQQAAVQNAQAFLQMDMQNLSNNQQTEMFKSQSIVQALFTDQAAENAAKQFNSASENQTKQFMANMANQVQQFNATQTNTTSQFNAGAENAAMQFNAQVENQRRQFNSQNALVIAQANAQWRQNLSTINAASQNQANMQQAQAANAFTQGTLDQIWQRERDLMDYAYKGSETAKDRALDIILADKKYEEYAKARDDAEETSMWSSIIKVGAQIYSNSG